MSKFSGRTTMHQHKFDDWQKYKGPFTPDIKQVTVFDVQWSECPVEVEEEVMNLWGQFELGNDRYFYKWDPENSCDNGDCDEANKPYCMKCGYPIIYEYLASKGIGKCWIYWWW